MVQLVANMKVSPRQELLDRIVDDVARNGIGDRSLRELAASVGSSHRMLLYHFGSREGLVAAIVATVERDQRDFLRALAEEATDPYDLVRRVWQRVSSPELRPFVRLFFESLAYTALRPGDHELTAPWLEVGEAVASKLDIALDAAEIRLGVAVTRGLLVDVLATGDLDRATESLEQFVSLWEGAH